MDLVGPLGCSPVCQWANTLGSLKTMGKAIKEEGWDLWATAALGRNLQPRLYSTARQAQNEPTGQAANSPKAESKVAAKKLDLELETSVRTEELASGRSNGRRVRTQLSCPHLYPIPRPSSKSHPHPIQR
jgi:hypothetical protein